MSNTTNMSAYFPCAWLDLLDAIMTEGKTVSPRGKLTMELPQCTVGIDMLKPVLTIPERKLNYQFMAAEAYWILSGDNTVEGIAPWNKNISQFSDDGKVFYGAYGPVIRDQLSYVVDKLQNDPSSRQAGLTIWRPNPPETKDVPCTVSMFFNIRDNYLNCHTFMRSSDAWLGVPYDVFNFSMLSHLVCARINECSGCSPDLIPGTLYLTAASSHLYEPHFEEAYKMLEVYAEDMTLEQPATPECLCSSEVALMAQLKALRDTKPGDSLRWWELN